MQYLFTPSSSVLQAQLYCYMQAHVCRYKSEHCITPRNIQRPGVTLMSRMTRRVCYEHRSIAGEFEDEAEGERTPWNFEAGNRDVTRQALMQSRQQPMRIRVCTDMSAN